MNVLERISQLNRVQHSRLFKLIASALVVLGAVAALTVYVVRQQAIDAPRVEVPAIEAISAEEAAKLSPEQRAQIEAAKSRHASDVMLAQMVNKILDNKLDPTAVAVGVGLATLLVLGVIWIGQGLSGLAVVLIVGGVCYPLYALGSSMTGDSQSTGRFIAGLAAYFTALAALSFAFIVLMELLRIAYSGPSAVLAIARNVVLESVRMKVSLVFIVLLVFGLAALPALLDASTPLRYRVQSFLQYGTGGAFWLIAILVLFLAVGSVAFEQRDKVIWQTMTKPVAAWQYILGKWLGVVGVAAVLLCVSASGVFLFTEYLRNQPANNERTAYVPQDGTLITEDRLVLETQVLVARLRMSPVLPQLSNEDEIKALQDRIGRAKASDPFWQETDEAVYALRRELREQFRADYLTIEPGNQEKFLFTGLESAKQMGMLVNLRYRVDVGANDPRTFWRLSFLMPNAQPVVQEVPLGQSMTIPVSPASINDKGELELIVMNGDIIRGWARDPSWINAASMSFPPDGLEVFYPTGSFRANFVRVAIVMWLKLGFLAMVAICAATFLSFSVASLVAFGTFLIAESAGFLNYSLEYFSTVDVNQKVVVWRVIIRAIALPIGTVFQFYGNLSPTTDLVEGKLVSWTLLVSAVGILGLLTGLLFVVAVTIFRKRELATYSGQ